MKKIPTLFERVYEGRKVSGVLPNITSGCEDAFKYGFATVKIDGAACAIIDGKLYKRYDAKGKNIPEGAIPCQNDPDPITGHFPCWVKCSVENKADKWFWAAYDKTMEVYSRDYLPDATYEAIGLHFNGNPYGMTHDELVEHGTQITTVERTFEGVKNWLETHNEEGLVFWFEGVPVCKIKRSDFGLKWGRSRG